MSTALEQVLLFHGGEKIIINIHEKHKKNNKRIKVTFNFLFDPFVFFLFPREK
jgi:hypothetical protein